MTTGSSLMREDDRTGVSETRPDRQYRMPPCPIHSQFRVVGHDLGGTTHRTCPLSNFEPRSTWLKGATWEILVDNPQTNSCLSAKLRLERHMFSICSLYGSHGYEVQGCIVRAWSERRGVSGGLRHQGAVPRGAGPAALAGRLRLPLLRALRAARRPAWRHSNGSIRRSATSSARSPGPIASSAPITPRATPPVSPGATTAVINSRR